jgi:L-ascorbate metabolism protein UlaG (beta-lactamase superfamily)
MKKNLLFAIIIYICLPVFLQLLNNNNETNLAYGRPVEELLEFIPVQHASFIIKGDDLTIFVDPVGDVAPYAAHRTVDVILITHAHPDHLAPDLVRLLRRPYTAILGPETVTEKLGFGTTIINGESKTVKGLKIEAVPAYNTTPERLSFHPQGTGNGYVISMEDGTRIYVSGDTEDISEMRRLENIDYAFVCMNLPYTMSVEQAASSIAAFKPRVVIPYHYCGKNGMSDLEAFKRILGPDSGIEIRELKWYD